MRSSSRAKICDSYKVLALLSRPKGPKLKPLCGPRAVWTPTRLVYTAVFCDSLQESTQKRETVDMWTPFRLIISKAQMSTSRGGGPVAQPRGLKSSFGLPLAHWGEPFHCPRPGVLYSSVGLAFHRLHEEGCGGQRSKRIKEGQGQTRGNSTLAGSSKRLLAECNTDTATL